MNWFSKLKDLQPAMVSAFFAAIASLFALWGLDITDLADRLGDSVNIIIGLIILASGWFTRSKVVPFKKVATYINVDTGEVIQGPAAGRLDTEQAA